MYDALMPLHGDDTDTSLIYCEKSSLKAIRISKPPLTMVLSLKSMYMYILTTVLSLKSICTCTCIGIRGNTSTQAHIRHIIIHVHVHVCVCSSFTTLRTEGNSIIHFQSVINESDSV